MFKIIHLFLFFIWTKYCI